MRYHQPFDQPGAPDASYANANVALGQRGSILDIIAVEQCQREILKVITEAGITPDDDDLTQLWQAILSLITDSVDTAISNSFSGTDTFNILTNIPYALTTGDDAMVGTFDPLPTGLYAGLTVAIKKNANANTGAVTFNGSAFGVKDVVHVDGLALQAGDLPGNGMFILIYNGTQWVLVTRSKRGPDIKLPYAVAAGTADAITATFNPVPTSLFAGLVVALKIGAATNTGAVTLNANGLGVVSVKNTDLTALTAGMLPANGVIVLVYDGTQFVTSAKLLGPSADFKIPYVTAGGTANSITVAPAPAFTAYTLGMTFWMQVASRNTSSVTVNVNALGDKALLDAFGTALTAGDMRTGETVLLVYDGTAFRMFTQRRRSRDICALYLVTVHESQATASSYHMMSMPAINDPNGWKTGDAEITVPETGLYEIKFFATSNGSSNGAGSHTSGRIRNITAGRTEAEMERVDGDMEDQCSVAFSGIRSFAAGTVLQFQVMESDVGFVAGLDWVNCTYSVERIR
jgi:hypothetical protein